MDNSMALEGHQPVGCEAQACKPLEATELRQVDDEGGADALAADPPTKLDGCLCGATGGDQVIDDQDAFAWPHGVLMHLDDVDAVFQGVFLADGLPRQLALLPQRHKPTAQPVGDGSTQDETARF